MTRKLTDQELNNLPEKQRREILWKRNHYILKIPKKHYCEICETELENNPYKNHHGKYCSEQCLVQSYYWRWNDSNRGRPLKEHICFVCEESFKIEGAMTSNKYCSIQCKIQGEIWNRIHRKSGNTYSNEYYYTRSKFRELNPPCQFCHKHWEQDVMELHHIEEHHKSKDDSKENLIWLCPTCHKRATCNHISKEELKKQVTLFL